MWQVIVAMTVAAGLIAGALTAADLQPAKNEPNLEKRSRLALANADQAISEAREAYEKPDMKVVEERLAEVRESVEYAKAALAASGKKPGRVQHRSSTRRRRAANCCDDWKD